MFFEKGVVSRKRNAIFLDRGFEEVFSRGAWGSPGMLLQIRLAKKIAFRLHEGSLFC